MNRIDMLGDLKRRETDSSDFASQWAAELAGEESGVPVFVRVTRNFTDQMALHLYGGVVAGGKLTLESSSGNKLREEDFDPAPLFGATFIGRF